MSELTAADFEAIGVYEPGAPHSALKLELLRYLVSLGATSDDLAAYRDELPGLASVLAIRAGEGVTLSDVVGRSGLPEEKVRQLTRVAGFAEPGPDDRVFTDSFIQLAAAVTAAEAVFGEEVVIQLTRVMGSAIGRIADSAVTRSDSRSPGPTLRQHRCCRLSDRHSRFFCANT